MSGQGMLALREVKQMEREMCAYLDCELNVKGKLFRESTARANTIFSGAGSYHNVMPEAGVPRNPAA
jgi:hypothetical protein